MLLKDMIRKRVPQRQTYISSFCLIICDRRQCLLRMTDITSAAQKAGQIATTNMTLFYLGPHLSYLADISGLSLSTMKLIHRSVTLSFILTVVFRLFVPKPSQPVFITGSIISWLV